MPEQHSNGKGEVTAGDLAKRFITLAQEQGVELRKGEIYGANLEALMHPGEVLHSNRRAFFEPDPIVDSIVSKEKEDIKRLERALKAAGTDPQARDELLGRMVGQNILHWMSVQPYAVNQANAQSPEPASNGHQQNAQQEALATASSGHQASVRQPENNPLVREPRPGTKLWTRGEVAYVLNRSLSTVDRLRRSGKLAPKSRGRFSRDDVEALAQQGVYDDA